MAQQDSPSPTRRRFAGNAAAAAAAFTIVPRHVLGGPGVVAPSDQITLGYIGCGTQGLREMPALIGQPDIRIVSVCDPCRDAVGYRDWSRDGLLNSLRRTLGKNDWGSDGIIPGGREVAKSFVETYYAANKPSGEYRGCTAYADYREMLDKEKDLAAVKVITPDHTHGVICVAAMKRGKHTMVHKPLANRLLEAKAVIETARRTGVSTHFIPWDANQPMDQVMAWIRGGEIGTLREVHNWSARPVWPQFAEIPADAPPPPDGFDWNLWLGPEAERPYHPNYTHMVFRGWYDFGGGAMADMGHYSLWAVFNALELSAPYAVEPLLTHQVTFNGSTTRKIRNDYSFPLSSVVRFKFAAKGSRPAIDLVWHDGGMRPPVPPELAEDLAPEGMMFVGDKGSIIGGFHNENPWLLKAGSKPAKPAPTESARRQREPGTVAPGIRQWIAGCRGGQHSGGSFLNAWPISESANLYGVALRAGRRIQYDGAALSVTGAPESYLTRQYRAGFALETT
jgi:hypothetical protein